MTIFYLTQCTQNSKILANKHMKICSVSLIIRKVQIKTIMRNHFIPTGMAIAYIYIHIYMCVYICEQNNKCW